MGGGGGERRELFPGRLEWMSRSGMKSMDHVTLEKKKGKTDAQVLRINTSLQSVTRERERERERCHFLLREREMLFSVERQTDRDTERETEKEDILG